MSQLSFILLILIDLNSNLSDSINFSNFDSPNAFSPNSAGAWSHLQNGRKIPEDNIQSNLDYSKCQGTQESFRIIGSLNDRKREFSHIFGKAPMLS